MINIENLTKRFDERIAVAGIDLEIKSGEIFGLLGPNGAGKTTLVKALLELVKYRGSITTDNDVTFEKKFRICKDMWI